MFNASGAQSTQHFGWYLVANGEAETWHVKHDGMVALLARLDPARAEWLCCALNDCVGCYGAGCLARRKVEVMGRTRIACHGRAMFGTAASDFEECHILDQVNRLWAEITAAGEPTAVE